MDFSQFAELAQQFQANVNSGPIWVKYWVDFMGLVFALAIPFSFIRVEARWAVLVMLLTVPTMLALYSQVGYVRLLGLPHVILWTPFLIYLLGRRHAWRVRETIAGKWLLLLTITIIISLAFDYADVGALHRWRSWLGKGESTCPAAIS